MENEKEKNRAITTKQAIALIQEGWQLISFISSLFVFPEISSRGEKIWKSANKFLVKSPSLLLTRAPAENS